MTQADSTTTGAKVWRSSVFGILCALVYVILTCINIPSTPLIDLLAGGTIFFIFGLVCWLWPPISIAYLLLLALMLSGSPIWATPMGWLGVIVLGLPGLAPFLLIFLPDFVRRKGKHRK